jgi:hypothetical protein
MPSLKEKRVANLDQKGSLAQKTQFDSKWATQFKKGSLAQKRATQTKRVI